MASLRRYIDQLTSPEKSESVEVIVLGLSRTGTMSMYNALNKLGYKSYHMSEACLMTGKGHLTKWNEAIRAKYGPSLDSESVDLSSAPLYTLADYQTLLQGYSAVTDAPTVLFSSELLAAYPHARLILTTHPRGVDAWLRSMRNSYFRIANWTIWSLLMKYDTGFSLPYLILLRRIVEVWAGTPWSAAKDFAPVESKLRSFYARHNQEMRVLAKKQDRELLEFHPAEGWQPLCKFLGKGVPPGPYPHYNEGDYVVTLHKYAVLMRLKTTFGASVITAMVALAAAGIALWWLR